MMVLYAALSLAVGAMFVGVIARRLGLLLEYSLSLGSMALVAIAIYTHG
jgi:hypothetical protein